MAISKTDVINLAINLSELDTSAQTKLGTAYDADNNRLLSTVMGKEDYSRYYNMTASQSYTAVEKVNDSSCRFKITSNPYAKEGDLYLISGAVYDGIMAEVLNVEYSSSVWWVTIDTLFISDSTGTMVNQFNTDASVCHAYVTLEIATVAFQELFLKGVLAEFKQFGEGNTNFSGQDELKKLRGSFRQKALEAVGLGGVLFG